jgi:hypothetical protein
MIAMSMKRVAYAGKTRLNQSWLRTPPTPRSRSNTSEIDSEPYISSSPRSSEIVLMKPAGLRTTPSLTALA